MRNLQARLLVATGVLALAAQALLVPPSSAAPTSLSVSFPADPIPVHLGLPVTFHLRVDNVGVSPLEVSIKERGVELGNNGHTTLSATSDATFGAVTKITPSDAVIAPHALRDVIVTVTVPKALSPNDYYLGFLVSPVVPSGSVAAPNDVGAFVVLDVPGARFMRLTTTVLDVPTVVFANSVRATIRVENTGKAVTTFSTDIEISGFVSPTPNLVQKPSEVVPPGHFRDELVKVHSWLGFGVYTFKATFVYALSATTTGEATAQKTIVLISPYWFAVPAVLVIVILWWFRRRRRRRRQPSEKPKRQHSKR